MKVKDKVYSYVVSFIDRLSIGGTGVGESEEEFKAALLEHHKGAKELIIEEVKYLGTVAEFVQEQQTELAEAELEAKPTIN